MASGVIQTKVEWELRGKDLYLCQRQSEKLTVRRDTKSKSQFKKRLKYFASLTSDKDMTFIHDAGMRGARQCLCVKLCDTVFNSGTYHSNFGYGRN